MGGRCKVAYICRLKKKCFSFVEKNLRCEIFYRIAAGIQVKKFKISARHVAILQCTLLWIIDIRLLLIRRLVAAQHYYKKHENNIDFYFPPWKLLIYAAVCDICEL